MSCVSLGCGEPSRWAVRWVSLVHRPWFSASREPTAVSQSAADAAPIMMRYQRGVLGGQQPPYDCCSYLRAVFSSEWTAVMGGMTRDFRSQYPA